MQQHRGSGSQHPEQRLCKPSALATYSSGSVLNPIHVGAWVSSVICQLVENGCQGDEENSGELVGTLPITSSLEMLSLPLGSDVFWLPKVVRVRGTW